jgi:hypothetical protein
MEVYERLITRAQSSFSCLVRIVFLSRADRPKNGKVRCKKIQAIYRASSAPNTGKVIEIAKENGAGKNRAQNRENRRKYRRVPTHRLVISTPTQTIARRREAPGAHVRD